MIYDDSKTVMLSEKLFEKGIYVVGFTYPVVPAGKARIRIQISSLHTKKDMDYFIETFSQI